MTLQCSIFTSSRNSDLMVSLQIVHDTGLASSPGGTTTESLQFSIMLGNLHSSSCHGPCLSVWLLPFTSNETCLNSHKPAMTMATTDVLTCLMILSEVHVKMVLPVFFANGLSVKRIPHCLRTGNRSYKKCIISGRVLKDML